MSDKPLIETQAAFAKRLGVAKSYVTALKQAGRLVMTPNGKRVMVSESMARINETGGARQDVADRWKSERDKQEKREETTADHADNRIGNSYQAARAVKEKFLAMAAKRDYEISMGKLLDAEEVESYMVDALATLRGRLESIPIIVGPQVAVEKDERRCVALVAEEIEHAMSELSKAFDKFKRDKDSI